jgi:hypothetical protein
MGGLRAGDRVIYSDLCGPELRRQIAIVRGFSAESVWTQPLLEKVAYETAASNIPRFLLRMDN